MDKKQSKGSTLTRISGALIALSVLSYIAVEILNGYPDISNDGIAFSIVLLVAASITFFGFIFSTITAFKVSGSRRVGFIFGAIITLILMLLELVSVVFSNAL